MLISFTFSNFRSFPKDATLSMLATKTVSENRDVDRKNVFNCPEQQEDILRIAAIYGANASGKSNIIKALEFVKGFVLNSSREGQAEDLISIDPFLLDEESPVKPIGFEIVFIANSCKWRYGFEIINGIISSEWLYRVKKRKVKIFLREFQSIQTSREIGDASSILKDITRNNALFISVMAQFNIEIGVKIIGWFRDIEFISPELQRSSIEVTSREMVKHESSNKLLNTIIKSLDVGIEEIISIENRQYDERTLRSMSEPMRMRLAERTYMDTKAVHKVYNSAGEVVDEVHFDLGRQESDGTQKLFSLIFPLVKAITEGGIVVIDEMDARLHPIITSFLMTLFSIVDLGDRCGQLIFTTHDTNLLSKDLLRRDQVWFVEKSSKGASELYSLIQYQNKNDGLFGKNYLNGKYGAIPFPNTELINQAILNPKGVIKESTASEEVVNGA